MRPRRPLLAAILALLAPTLASAQSVKPIVVENIRVGFSETFKVGSWTPVWVQARAGVEPFDGSMEVVVDDESGVPTKFRQDVHIGAGDTARLTAYMRTGSLSGDLSVVFHDRDGKPRGKVDLDKLNPNNLPRPIFSDEIAILALGKAQGVEKVPSLPGLNGNRTPQGSTAGTSVVDVLKFQAMDGGFLPGRAIGYDELDAIVLDTNDREIMAALAVQGDAIKEWVDHGGHLVVAVGRNWQVVRDSVLAPILPATPNGTIRINDIGAIEAFAGGGASQLATDTTSLTIAKLEGAEAKGGKVLCSTATSPIVVRGAYGFGRVTLVGLDVDQPPFSTWDNNAQFWSRAIDLHPTGSGLGQNAATARFRAFGVGDLSSQLKVSLDQFPGVKLIPFGWVAFFIFIYILLIGPGDYFFLRKVLKRMELTWITFPAIVLLVSGVAYWAAYKAKGTELRVNQVDVLDVDVASNQVRGASFVNVFSPRNLDYDVAIVPKPINGGPSMPPGTETRVSWFGAPEQGLRGMNGGGRPMGFGSSAYSYAPTGRAERLEGVRIPIWSTKAFTARWFAPIGGEPIIESDLVPSGIDRLNGTITNRLDIPLKGAILIFNSQVYYKLGTIAPGESKQVELTPDRTLSGHLDTLRQEYDTQDPNNYYAPPPINRYALMQAILFRSSEPPTSNALPSRPLHDLDLTGQLQLDRPMLVAEIDRPVAELDLGSAPAASKTDRTTVLRVILPLKKK